MSKAIPFDWPRAILLAQQAGYAPFEEEGWWYVTVPARPRVPEHVQGGFKSQAQAWRFAAALHHDLSLNVAA